MWRKYFIILLQKCANLRSTLMMKHTRESKEGNEDEFRRINVKLDPTEYERFEILAADDKRSMTNLASVLISRYIREAWERRVAGEKKAPT